MVPRICQTQNLDSLPGHLQRHGWQGSDRQGNAYSNKCALLCFLTCTLTPYCNFIIATEISLTSHMVSSSNTNYNDCQTDPRKSYVLCVCIHIYSLSFSPYFAFFHYLLFLALFFTSYSSSYLSPSNDPFFLLFFLFFPLYFGRSFPFFSSSSLSSSCFTCLHLSFFLFLLCCFFVPPHCIFFIFSLFCNS